MAAAVVLVLPHAGHFTQLVWKSSTMLGCATNVCPSLTNSPLTSGTLVICRYLPFGNIKDAFAANVLPPLPPVHATFIPEGAVLAAPDCYTSPNNRYLLCMRRDSRLMLMHRGNHGNYTLWCVCVGPRGQAQAAAPHARGCLRG